MEDSRNRGEEMNREFHQAVVIGGGPAGLTAGIYLMRAGVDAIIVEKILLGGTPAKYERIENYPGFPEGVSSKELVARMAEQGKRLGLVTKELAEVEGISPEGGLFVLRAAGEEITCAAVLVASGTASKKLDIQGEQELLGRGVSTCATCDGAFFRNCTVAVIGGGDAAIQEAMVLANIAGKVYVVHRRDALRAQKILQERAFRNSKIEFLWNRKPVEIVGQDEVKSLILEDTKTHERSELKVDGVFVYAGASPDTAFLGDLVERDASGFVVTDENLATKTPGIFAAGDVRKKLLRQVSTAVGDGALAAVSLERFLLERE